MTNVYSIPVGESGERGPRLAFIEGFDPLHVADGLDSLTVSIDNSGTPVGLKLRSQALLDSITHAAFIELGAIADRLDEYGEIKVTSAYPTGPGGADAYCAVYDASASRAARAALDALPEDDEPMLVLINHIAARYDIIGLRAAYDDEPLTPWNKWLNECAVHVEDDIELPEKLGFELSEEASLLPAMAALSCIADIEALRGIGMSRIQSIAVTQPSGGSYELCCAASWVAEALNDLYLPIVHDEDRDDADEDEDESDETGLEEEDQAEHRENDDEDGDEDEAEDEDEYESEDIVHDAISAILEDAGFRARAKEIEKAYGVKISAYEGEPFDAELEKLDAETLEDFLRAARAAGRG